MGIGVRTFLIIVGTILTFALPDGRLL